MKFVSLQQIEKFLPSNLSKTFNDNPSIFETLEAAAAEIIVSASGLTVPTSVNDTPEFVFLPAAWIIVKIAKNQFGSNYSADKLTAIENDYKSAISNLNAHKSSVLQKTIVDANTNETALSFSGNGDIRGSYE